MLFFFMASRKIKRSEKEIEYAEGKYTSFSLHPIVYDTTVFFTR
jgi:hypothetical protein